MNRRIATILAVVLTATPAFAGPANVPATPARWTRAIVGQPMPTRSYRAAPVFVTLGDGSLLARNGGAIVKIDERGVTRWSMPNVADAIADGDTIVFRRTNAVFAVRSADAGVLWKRPCAGPPFIVAAGARIVTMCGGQSTVLSARDGSVLSRRTPDLPTGKPSIDGARQLNDDYVLVSNFFDGAWMGNSYYVVNAHTGAFLWSQTDFKVVDVTAATVAITPYPSMLPWGSPGYIVRRRLADGATVGTRTYDYPIDRNDSVRGDVALSRAAAYVLISGGPLYRYPRGETRDPQKLVPGASLVETLGSSAFIFVREDAGGAEPTGSVYLDRPSRSGGGFVTRSLGQFAGSIATRTTFSDGSTALGARVGDRIAVADEAFVRLYDESGAVELTVRKQCSDPQIAATRSVLFVACAYVGASGRLAGFPRPR